MANNLIINRLFTLAAFQKLIDGTDSRVYSEIVNSYVDKSAVHTNGEAIAEIYKFMKKEYRNQYYYKNTILNRLLLGVHSINTTTALTEIPISTSKADFVLINAPSSDISEEDADCMIRTIEKFYQIMCERRKEYDKDNDNQRYDVRTL